MYSIYKHEDGDFKKVFYEDSKDELDALKQYQESTGKRLNNCKWLGSSKGMVYRISFTAEVDGFENEYMLIHNPWYEDSN